MQAEREFTLDQQANRSLPQSQSAEWTGQMNRFSAQQRQGQLFANCMSSRGYKLVPAAAPSDDPAAGAAEAPAK